MNAFLTSLWLAVLVLTWTSPAIASATRISLVEDFESSHGGFTTTSVNSWKWGAPTSPDSPSLAHSGTRVWGTNLTGSYASNLDATVVSPVYDLSAAVGQHIVLQWWQHLVTEEGFDYAEVQVSNNSGGTWTTVLGPAHGATQSEWRQHTVLLDPSFATAGFQVRFRFVTDSNTSVGGFFIDDLRLCSAGFTQISSLQDFETDDGGYVEEGAHSSWEHGVPVSLPSAAFSGEKVWATNLNGFYNADENSTLTSPVHDLSSAAGRLLAVTWKQSFDTEEGYDFLHFEVSPDGGTTWTELVAFSGPLSTSGWMAQQAFVPASFATSAFRLRFRFTSDDAYQYSGVALDDIAVLSTQDLFPTASVLTKSAPQNRSISFTTSDFSSVFTDPVLDVLKSIVLTQLPTAGALKVGGAAVVLNATLTPAELATLTYEPEADTSGSWTFGYQALNYFGPSATALVTLNILSPSPQVMIADHPQPLTVNPGATATFEVLAVSSLALEYQWRKNSQPIEGATSASYTLSSAQEEDDGTYDVVVSNTGDSATSHSATLSVNRRAVITSQPTGLSVNEGGDISFSVTATGTGRLDYQWYKDGQPLVGETFNGLTVQNAQEANGGNYHCTVTNITGPTLGTPFPLTILLAPRIRVHPASIGVPMSRSATFEVAVDGAGPFTYQWFKDGFAVPGATESSLVIKKLLEENMGYYHVQVSNGWASTESNPARLQVVTWTNVRGLYQDVLEREAAPEGETPFPGRITVTSTGKDSITGVLTYDGSSHAFSGVFDSHLVIQRTIRRGKRPPLNLRLQLDAVALTVAATVTYEEASTTVTSSALLPKHSYDLRVNPAPQIGRYTALLAPDAEGPSSRAFLTGKVSAAGLASWVGRLPSGAAITGSGYIHSTGRVPLHMILRGAAGELGGRLSFDLQGDIPLIRDGLTWRHRPKVKASVMPIPFVSALSAEGSLYKAPKGSQPVLSLPQQPEMFLLRIEGPFTEGTLERWLRLAPRHIFRIDPVTDAKVQLRVNPAQGTLSGSFIDTTTRRRLSMNGVVVQGYSMMGGFFRGLPTPGHFLVTPRID